MRFAVVPLFLVACAPAAMPVRFTQVAPGLYRGGQPSVEQVGKLRELGVRTIISLRDGGEDEAAAKRLGIRFVRFSMSALSEPSAEVLRAVVAAIDPQHGAVYVHCKQGRDRTSLVIALYRVLREGWAPQRAWKSEALDFGHRGWPFMLGLKAAFLKLTS